MQRSRIALLTALVLVGSLLAATGGAAGAEPIPPRAETKIVGGQQSATGQFPWTVALTRRGYDRMSGFACGGTVLSPSWILTASHCILDYDDQYPDSTYGNYVAPSYYDVLTGINSLAQDGGGQRLPVVAIYAHPNFDFRDLDTDFALLRVGRPTSSPAIRVVGTSAAEQALDDAGAAATTIGWGTTSSGASTIPTFQRFVNISVNSNSTCQGAYPIGRVDDEGYPLEFHPSTMLCAGPMAGGKDSCQGDSGGPLAVQAGDSSWRQIGVVSFGYGCAFANNPGIYSRLTAASSWIASTRRFGPFNADGTAYITRMYRDYTGKSPTAAQLANWKTKLAVPSDLPVAFQNGEAWQGSAGAVTRLYSAAFERLPDASGLSHWIGRRQAGVGPVAIANNYATSSEFLGKYGSLNNDDFITQIYSNIFDRAADAGGRSYWLNKLNSGVGRGQMLYELSNSNEYRTDTASTVRVVTSRFALLRSVPTPTQLAAEKNIATRQLLDNLRNSVAYANRFTS